MASVVVDGSLLEGGGQVLRISVALSALLGVPLVVEKIRANRKPSGLRAQHLTGIQLVQDLVQGKLDSGFVTSTSITFTPNEADAKRTSFEANTQTAGSVALLTQIALPCLFFYPSPVSLTLIGGTNASHAPMIDYVDSVFRPIVANLFGIEFSTKLIKRGFFPKGGGKVVVNTQPVAGALRAFDLTDCGQYELVEGFAYVSSKLPLKIASRIAKATEKAIQKRMPTAKIAIEAKQDDAKMAPHVGCGVLLRAHSSTGCLLANSALGEKGVPSETVGEECANGLLEDILCEDQLIIFAALAKGTSRFTCGELTLHTQTAIHWCQHIAGAKFTVTPLSGKANLIECEGIGYVGRFK